MSETWTLSELVTEAAARIAALPPPKNGQVRAVPDERTIRYYGTLGLLDRPVAMRGRTAIYGARHLAQVVAIKRLQSAGRSLAEIQALWPTLDDEALSRMTGIAISPRPRASRADFWKSPPAPVPVPAAVPAAVPVPVPVPAAIPVPAPAPVAPSPSLSLRLDLAPGIHLVLTPPPSTALSASDLHTLLTAAQPLLAALATLKETP